MDISAKLQEDPLVAIKKREDEARRQFLQNPVQLKKLQEALKAQELKKKKVKRKKSKDDSDSDIDSKIVKKLKYLKADPSDVSVFKKKRKRSKDNSLDTILMHKFNELKDRLSQEDLNDILAGNVSDSDEDAEKKDKKYKRRKNPNTEENDQKQNKLMKGKRGRISTSSENYLNKRKNKRKNKNSSSDTSSADERCYRRNHKKGISNECYDRNKNVNCKKSRDEVYYKSRESRSSESKRHSSGEDTSEVESRKRSDNKFRKKISDEPETKDEHKRDEERSKAQEKNVPDYDLESKILEKLRILRESSKSKRSESSSDSENEDLTLMIRKNSVKSKVIKNPTNISSSSDSEEPNLQNHRYDSDSDRKVPRSRTFGLVKADGSKITLNRKPQEVKKTDNQHKVETVKKPDRKNVKRLTEDEKEQMRREMMQNAEKREKERSENLRRYREEDRREEKSAGNFDKDFVHKELLKSAKEATVESRIKSNLNNIQRSSRHMDTHFSRR